MPAAVAPAGVTDAVAGVSDAVVIPAATTDMTRLATNRRVRIDGDYMDALPM
jgi:hypothetical protein